SRCRGVGRGDPRTSVGRVRRPIQHGGQDDDQPPSVQARRSADHQDSASGRLPDLTMLDRIQRRLAALAVRPYLPQRTLRLRLTALYGGLFLACGDGLLGITYVLVEHATGGNPCSAASSPGSICGAGSAASQGPHSQPNDGTGSRSVPPTQALAVV